MTRRIWWPRGCHNDLFSFHWVSFLCSFQQCKMYAQRFLFFSLCYPLFPLTVDPDSVFVRKQPICFLSHNCTSDMKLLYDTDLGHINIPWFLAPVAIHRLLIFSMCLPGSVWAECVHVLSTVKICVSVCYVFRWIRKIAQFLASWCE